MRLIGIMAVVVAMASSTSALAATATTSDFGRLQNGETVQAITLANSHGMKAKILAFGATLQSLIVPDRNGHPADVVLGFDDLDGYVHQTAHFGASVGRYANRIANGQFTLDGKTYQLAKNDGPNALHGGVMGFEKHLWKINSVKSGPTASVSMTYVSPDGDEGYPGTLTTTATYSLNEKNELILEYRATTDKPTIVNLTNHSYFNLAGEGSNHPITEEWLTIPANSITPVNATLIPTGAFRPVAGTPFDFRTPHLIGERIRDGRDEQLAKGHGYDHNFVVTKAPTADLHLMARVEDPFSGRVMEMLSNQPGVQFYSGNFLNAAIAGKNGHLYRQGDALALEPQVFPDTPNQPKLGSARLDPGQVYVDRIVYRFSTTARR
ncbi:MAG TPA: aldose epimerase family protein [Sphingomicrobium sp.]|nr:aldose epimerase family protein [Sphingomicrobium sp.]